ncbi:MAG: hypothetical protein PF505_01630 [Vallitaleaceae bacterium]|nr:hypothetical protein [Vallitaleaceae bacterium]
MTNSSKIMLVVMAIVIVFGVYYFVPYKSMVSKETLLKSEVSTLQTEYNGLVQELQKKDEYVAGIEIAKEELNRLASLLPQNLPQENTIALVYDMEQTLGLEVTAFTMTEELVETSFEDATNPENNEYGIRASLTTQVTCTYDQLKELLNYVNNNQSRMVLRDLTLVSNVATGELTTSINLSSYGLRLFERENIEASLGEFDHGKNSVFEPYDAYSSAYDVSTALGTSEEDVADFFIFLDPTQSDRTTTTLGKSGDPAGLTYILEDNDKVSSGEVNFYQVDGVYYYRYKVGTISYPTNYTQGYIFEPGEELEIQIFSADRLDETDVSGLDLSIINETDMVVNIVYYSEDFEDPRLALTSEGPVAIH